MQHGSHPFQQNDWFMQLVHRSLQTSSVSIILTLVVPKYYSVSMGLSKICCVHDCHILPFLQTLFFILVVNARLSLTPGTVAPEMDRCVSVLTAVLFLHENTDHVTGIHKSNQLHERKGKAIIRTLWTLINLLLQSYINTGITAIFRKNLLQFPEFICKFQSKWSQTDKLKRLSLFFARYIIF